MDDLIERLRQEARDNYDEISAPKCLWWEAADEVERLRWALEKITGCPNGVECREIARAALGDGE